MPVFLCKWKKTATGYKFWLKGKPAIWAEAEDIEETWIKLSQEIMSYREDICSFADVQLEFEPPITEKHQEFFNPELFVIYGDEPFESSIRGFLNADLYESGCVQNAEHLWDLVIIQ